MAARAALTGTDAQTLEPAAINSRDTQSVAGHILGSLYEIGGELEGRAMLLLLYRILLFVDAVAIALFVALGSREFGSERIGDSASVLWAAAAVGAILLGNSLAPKRRAYLIVADVVLLLIAVPAVLMAFLIVAFTINPSHH